LPLNENHKRRLLAAFQQMDKLLSQSKNAMASKPSGLYARYIHDISESESRKIDSSIEKIREQISGVLERFQIVFPPPSTPASWILKTNLTSLDIAFEDLYPDKMQGYGKMDPKTAHDLTASIEATRKLLRQLLESLERK
jgi:hypothetical protein